MGILDLSDFRFDERNHSVFYSSKDFIAYRDRYRINFSDCQNNILASYTCPADFLNFEMFENDAAIVIILGGKNLIAFDKKNKQSYQDTYNITNIGRCITKIVSADTITAIVFGTLMNKKVQLVNFDFIDQVRRFQTQSWELNNINDICQNGSNIYLLISGSLLVATTTECETIWTKFETGIIRPNLLTSSNNLYYNYNSFIKSYKSDPIRLPTLKVSSLESLVEDGNLYCTVGDRSGICCYNLKSALVTWEIRGNSPIDETLTIKGRDKSGTWDIMLFRSKDHFGMINLNKGKTILYRKCDGIHKLRLSGDHVLIHKRNKTEIISGANNV